MTIPLAYRNQLLAQFVQSIVTFGYKKRVVASLQAKVAGGGTLTVDEANILSHYQADIVRDRAILQIWKEGLQDHTKFGFPAGSYTLAQVKTFILNNRAAVIDLLTAKIDEEMAEIDGLKDQEMVNRPLEGENLAQLLAEWQARLDELDDRKAMRRAWKDLHSEFKAKTDTDFLNEGEI